MENLTNPQKIELSVLLADALQSTNGLRHQIEEIQTTFNDHTKLHRSMEWLDMIKYGLEKMKRALDEVTDWAAMEGTDSQPER
jgi:hypothetical protein